MPPADAQATLSLAAAQRLLWRIIVAPQGVEAALRELDGAGGPQGAEQLASLIRGDATLPAERRVGVYASAYFERIRGVFEQDFPALRESLGEAPFHDLATSYLAVRPPEHFSLRYAGDRLASFVAQHAAGEPFRQRWPWCADLARLEWALCDAFDAADAPGVRREQLASVAPEAWAELRLEFTPSVQLLDVAWTVAALRRRHETGPLDEASVHEVRATRETICVWRDRERVFHRVPDATEADALREVSAGTCFGALCELAARELGEDAAASAAAGWLARWLDDGLLARAELPD